MWFESVKIENCNKYCHRKGKQKIKTRSALLASSSFQVLIHFFSSSDHIDIASLFQFILISILFVNASISHPCTNNYVKQVWDITKA